MKINKLLSLNNSDDFKMYIPLIGIVFATTVLGSLLTLDLNIFYTASFFASFSIALFGFIGYFHIKLKSLPLAILIFLFYNIIVLLLSQLFLIFPIVILSILFYLKLFKSVKIPYIFNRYVVLSSIFATIIILGIDGTGDFLILDKIRVGIVEKDTLFHASIASMMKNYFSVSTGVNGLVETPYYILSHALFASFSILNKNSVLLQYGHLQLLFFLPLLFLTLTNCVSSIAITEEKNKKHNLQKYFLISISVFLLFRIFLPVLDLVRIKEIFLTSESFTLSLCIFFISIPFIIKKEMNIKDFLLISVLFLFMGYAKTTTALIFLGFFGIRFILKERKFLLPIMLIIFIFYLFNYSWIVSDRITTEIKPLGYIIKYCFYGDALEQIIYNKIFAPITIIKSIISLLVFLILSYFIPLLTIVFFVSSLKTVVLLILTI